MMRLALPFFALTALVACGEPPTNSAESEPPVQVTEAVPEVVSEPSVTEERPVAPTVTTQTAAIDWSAARSDLARANAMARTVPSEGEEDASSSFQIQSGGEEAPAVPVLLPTGIVSVQRAGSGPKFRQTDDGYFARYPGLAYDIVVHGTNEITAIDGQVVLRDEDFDFADMAGGAQVSLSRYGADYLVTFECNGADGTESGCITEPEALEVARGLIIRGSR